MKVIIITHHYLDDNSGGSFASRAYINAFSEIADTCMLLFPDRGIPISNYIHMKCIQIGVRNNRTKIQKFIDIYRGRIHRYTDILIPQIQKFKPDIVVFDNSITSAGMLKRVKSTGVKIVIIHHNYEMEYYKGTKPFFAWRIPFMHALEEAEKIAVQDSDLNLTLTEEDKSLLQKHYDPFKLKKVVKLGCFEPGIVSIPTNIKEKTINQIPKKSICFVITGTLGDYQTEVSLIPFLENEYPLLLKLLPKSKLIIAGRNPTAKIVNACSKYPSVDLIENPENMQDVISKADVYICPTSVGGGLKLRIMDGLKAGLPVLAHSVSARGYDAFQDAGYLFSYFDAGSFDVALKKIIELNKAADTSKKIIDLYNLNFSFESGVDRIRKIIATI